MICFLKFREFGYCVMVTKHQLAKLDLSIFCISFFALFVFFLLNPLSSLCILCG